MLTDLVPLLVSKLQIIAQFHHFYKSSVQHFLLSDITIQTALHIKATVNLHKLMYDVLIFN